MTNQLNQRSFSDFSFASLPFASLRETCERSEQSVKYTSQASTGERSEHTMRLSQTAKEKIVPPFYYLKELQEHRLKEVHLNQIPHHQQMH